MYDPIWSVLVIEGDFKAVVVGRESGVLEKYRLSDLKGKPILSLKTAHKGTITTLALSPQGGDEVYSASLDRSICQWNLTDDAEQLEQESGGKRLIKSTLTTTGVRCGVFVNEIFCCGGSDGGVHALRDGTPERWMGHSDAVASVAQCQTENGDGLLASGSYDGTIRIWNVGNAVCIYLLEGHSTQVKAVQFINANLGVMGVGRDDTMRLWLLPEEVDLEGNGGGGAVHDDDEEGGEDGAGATNGHGGSGPKRLKCAAVLGLPAAPLCAATQQDVDNPILAVGLSGGALLTVKANKFLSTVSSYAKINGSEVKKELKRLTALVKTEEKKEKVQRQKAIRKKQKELMAEQHAEDNDKRKAEREAKAEARRAGRSARDEDEYEEEDEEERFDEPEDDADGDEEEEEGDGAGLTEERQSKLQEFKDTHKKESDERLKTLRNSVTARKHSLEPIGVKKFERDAKQLESLPFTRVLPRASDDSINAVSFNGSSIVVASGNSLRIVDGTFGVQSI